jgi:3-methyladenine DNA glycosylase/8-oxoguanine DNA glycosylase
MATRAKVEAAARELARRDPVLKRMLRDHGVPDLHRHGRRRPHFAELARMICYQQLAGRAAAAIHGRFEALFDGPPTAEAVLAVPFDTLRGVGLSNAKAMSIRDLATKVEEGQVELDRVARLSDEKVVSELVLVRGIGEWTAHMFLMFQCGRIDVWPIGDYGVRMGFARMYGLDPMPTPKELGPAGDPYRPYRSLVAWWCWRAADTTLPT